MWGEDITFILFENLVNQITIGNKIKLLTKMPDATIKKNFNDSGCLHLVTTYTFVNLL